MPAFVNTMPDLAGYACDRYQFVELICAGNYGAVYRAADTTAPSSSSGRDRRTDRAIKVVPKDDETFGALEIDLHRRVSHHPHVVTLVNAFEEEDYYFLVLDIHPSDLHTKIWGEHAYDNDDERVRVTFLQIVDAVEACHAAGVYHHDLKPGNILCNEDGSKAYLCDFGMSSDLPINREFGSGTLSYMSPECLGEDIGCMPYSNVRHDIWALGIILINMITGSQPWTKASTADDQFCDYLHTPTFLLDNFDVSEGASDILRKVLVLNPMGRIGLAELRAAIVALPSFFRARNPPSHRVDEPEQADDITPGFSIVEDPEEEFLFGDGPICVWPATGVFDAPGMQIEQSPKLDLHIVDAVVRAFMDGDVNPDALPVCLEATTASPSRTNSCNADLEGDCASEFDDSDSDGPITPESSAGPEVNVYEGMFTEDLEERTIALPQSSTATACSKPMSSPFAGTGRMSRTVC